MDQANHLTQLINEVVTSEPFRQQLRTSFQDALQSSPTTASVPCVPKAFVEAEAATTAINEVRRLFPSIRRPSAQSSSNDRNFSHKSQRKGRKRATRDIEIRRDVILLNSPIITMTLTGQSKSNAFETGFGLCAVAFKRNWSEQEIYEYLANLFTDKLKDIRFEILIPMSRCLIRPNLPTGDTLNGVSLGRIFYQKCIYLRPFEHLNDRFEELSDDEIQEVLPESSVATRENTTVAVDRDAKPENAVVLDEFEQDLNKVLELTQTESVSDILKELKETIDSDQVTYFNIYREDVFGCCLRAVKRKKFSPLHRISVSFTDIDNVSEGAYDVGGPLREMFRLVLNWIQNSKMFQGPENSKSLRLCNESLQKGEYFEAGRLIVLSIVHGGPAPNFLSDTLFSLLSYGIDSICPVMEDIYDENIKEDIKLVNKASDLKELQNAVINSKIMSIAGIFFVDSFDKKEDIVKDAIKFYTVHRNRTALEQFKDGLNTLNFFNRSACYPSDLRNLLCHQEEQLTWQRLNCLFVPVLSETGSNRRHIENAILAFWRDYLLDCNDEDDNVDLSQILCFATGTHRIPPLGFEQTPNLEFLHDEKECIYPKGNTCSLVLSLPVGHKSYDEFKFHMDYGIQNGMVFGFA